MASKIFAEMLANIRPETMQYVKKNVAIAYQVRDILENHPTIHSQKDLAEALGKEPSEISKWLSGLHNIGLENITKMETVLDQDIILTVEQAKERYGGTGNENYQEFQTVNCAGETCPSDYSDETTGRTEIFLSPDAAIEQTAVNQEEKNITELAY